MFTFLIGNNNPYFDRKLRIKPLGKKMENVEISLKKKIEIVKKFNPLSCYYSSDDEDEINQTQNSKKSEDGELKDNKSGVKSNEAIEKIQKYKRYMKYLDISICLLLIFGVILSHVENEFFYEENMDIRVFSIQAMNYLKDFSSADNYTSVYKSDDFKDFLDVTNIPLNFFQNITDFSKIEINLVVPTISEILRSFIFISSCLASNPIHKKSWIECCVQVR